MSPGRSTASTSNGNENGATIAFTTPTGTKPIDAHTMAAVTRPRRFIVRPRHTHAA
jgi:hypothetical protein